MALLRGFPPCGGLGGMCVPPSNNASPKAVDNHWNYWRWRRASRTRTCQYGHTYLVKAQDGSGSCPECQKRRIKELIDDIFGDK
jgi:hypothetical protein